MYKIYFDNKPLFLVREINKELQELMHREKTVFIDDFNSHSVNAMIHKMESAPIQTGICLHENIDALLKAFKQQLQLIVAAGGLVYNPRKEILLIHRRGKWDLPKGKLDDEEELEICAEREIKEETGLQELHLEKPLAITYHTYHQFGKHILKESHWYLFTSPGQASFLPQLEEDIDKCEWVAAEQLPSYMENTHASVIDVVTQGLTVLRESENI